MITLVKMEKELLDALNSGTYNTRSNQAMFVIRNACSKISREYYNKYKKLISPATADVDDLISVVWDKVMKNYQMFDPGKNDIEGFIRGITYNTVIDFIRKEKRQSILLSGDVGEFDINSYAATYCAEAYTHEVGEDYDSKYVIDQICEVAKRCLSETELRVFEIWKDGGKNKRVSEELSMTPQQAANMVYKLRQKLKNEIRKEYPAMAM